jgi:hypothetical protein
MATGDRRGNGLRKIRLFLQFLILLNALIGVCLYGRSSPHNMQAEAMPAQEGIHL